MASPVLETVRHQDVSLLLLSVKSPTVMSAVIRGDYCAIDFLTVRKTVRF